MSELSSTFFEVELHDHVAHLIMNRPQKLNAMSPDFWDDLPRLTRALEGNKSIRAVVISARGKHFTAGMDLNSFQTIMDILKHEPGRASYELRNMVLKLQDSFNALEQARFPVIAAIHGACIGGGIDLISACDIRLATRDASFSIEEINIGMTADLGTLQRMPKLVAPGIVKELAYTGRKFSAEEAASWGFVNSVSDDADSLVENALAMAQEIAAKSPLAIAGSKQSINFAVDHQIRDGLEQIATWNGGMLRPEDLMGAIQAKMAKKKALFKDLA